MAFRAEEAVARGFDRARNYLVPRDFSLPEKARAESALNRIHKLCGPVVDAYPSWHPLVAQHDGRNPARFPDESCGYHGLDHTVYFAHGFVTCPYADCKKVVESALKIRTSYGTNIEVEELDVELYNNGTRSVMVRCEWSRPLDGDYLVPKSMAVPLMLEQEVPVWRWSERAETWETMRPYLLGDPHGSRSSLFVGQETALAIKKIYLSLVESGMFGPLKGV